MAPDHQKETARRNVEALEAVQPQDLGAGEIGVRIGANWVPVEVYQQFMVELLTPNYYVRDRIRILRSEATGQWSIREKNADRSNVKANTTYGTKRMSAYHILEQTLNQRDVRVFDYIEDENGKKKPVLNKKETAIAQDRQELIKQKFAEWIWKDIDRRELLCRVYNETFNGVRPREYDGRHIRFEGMNPEISLRPHQINAIAHIQMCIRDSFRTLWRERCGLLSGWPPVRYLVQCRGNPHCPGRKRPAFQRHSHPLGTGGGPYPGTAGLGPVYAPERAGPGGRV